MRKLVFLFFLVGECCSARAQKVFNIRAEQHGQDIVVFYFLETTSPCEVSLLLSQDNGENWSLPLKNVSGDVGKNISGGKKQITWKVLEEKEYLVGDNMKFKVIAYGKKSFEPEMVFIEGGTFQMGRRNGDADERPVHNVKLDDFNLGKYEVTQAQWRMVMGSNPSYNEDCDKCPVEQVSWNDVQEYIRKLNAQTGRDYRLPTEAEWEYAAKGGKKSKGFTYSGSNDLGYVAWYHDNSGNQTHNVGEKQANELGVFDMTGNVWEWCSDWYGIYSSVSETNPTGPSLGQERVLRGCFYNFNVNFCPIEFRSRDYPGVKGIYYGLRLVLPADNTTN